MRGISFKIGLLGMSLLGGPVAAGELEPTLEGTVRWTAKHSPGTNSVAHAGGRAYVASGTKLQAIALDSEGEVEDGDENEDLGEVEIPVQFGAITSVAAHGDLVAVSVTDAGSKTAPGSVLIYRFPFDTEPPQKFEVGVGPDMLAFSPLGNKLLVANEGEPECRDVGGIPTLDERPEGSISIIDLDHGIGHTPSTLNFAAWNGHEQGLIDNGVRIYGPGATAAQDLEPEHIAIGPFGLRAWVTLQENNAVALLDLWHNPPRVVAIRPLGEKDYGAEKNAVDIIDDQEKGELQQYPNLLGMYQPDGIEVGFIGGRTYVFTANEGDAREYISKNKEECIKEDVKDLGSLRVTKYPPHDGNKKLFAFGGRSFSVWDSDMNLIYDSGSTIEKRLAEPYNSKYFFDVRSDDKGPEPEDLVLGRIGGRPYLFVGLERANGVMAFDVSEPKSPLYAGFIRNPFDPAFMTVTNADGTVTKADGEEPERLDFVPAPSPTEPALLLVTNELSGSTRAFELSAPQ